MHFSGGVLVVENTEYVDLSQSLELQGFTFPKLGLSCSSSWDLGVCLDYGRLVISV